MAHDERNAKRGPDGKFLPGHKPPKSPGRPPGSNGIKARAARLANDRLEEMLEDNVIEGELERFTEFLSICPLDLRMSVMQRIKSDHGESLYPLFVKIEAFLEAYYEGVRSVY